MNDDTVDLMPRVAAAHLKGHDGPVHIVRFTADGKYCLSGGNDRTIRLWNPYRADPAMPRNTTNDAVRFALPIKTYENLHSYPISSLAIDASSQKLVSSSEKTLLLSDVVTGQFIRKFHGHEGRINSVACAQDASLFISGSYDATVRIWDGRSRSNEPIQVLNDALDSVSTVLLVEDNKEILSSSVDGCVRTYDVRSGKLRVDTCTEAVTGVCLSNDRLCLASSCLDGNIHLLEKETGMLLNTYSSTHVAGNYGLECGITSNDANIVSGSEDGNVVIYELVSGKVAQVLKGHTKPTCSIATCPRRDKWGVVLSASFDGGAIVWASPSEVQRWER